VRFRHGPSLASASEKSVFLASSCSRFIDAFFFESPASIAGFRVDGRRGGSQK
jgi:hypothetical protein